MVERNTGIDGSQIKNLSIKPEDMKRTGSAPTDGQVLSYDTATELFEWIDAGGAGEALEKSINQSSHGFIVGNILKYDGSNYAKAKADNEDNAEVIGIVSEVTDSNNFKIIYGGYIDLGSGTGLTAGEVYFLSGITAGALTSTEPSTEGHISKPVLIAVSSTAGYFFNMRGAEVEGVGGTATYNIAFTNGDLSSGILTVTHNLGFDYPLLGIYDNNNKIIEPDEITYVNSNSVQIDLSSFGTISGTWRVRVVGGAWKQSIIKDEDYDTYVEVEKTTDEDIIHFYVSGVEVATLDSSGLKLASGADINEFSIDGTLAGDSDDAVPTEKAVKTYADTKAPNDPKYIVGDVSGISGLSNEILSKDIGLQNLLLNGDFEYWYAGTSLAPDAWTLQGGGSIAREGTTIKIGNYSTKLTSDADGNYLEQEIHTEKGIAYWKGRTITVACWVYASDASIAKLRIGDAIGNTDSSYHSGTPGWELLTATRTIDNSATKVAIFLMNLGNTKVVYFDGTMLVEGSAPFAYTPHPEDHLYKQTIFNLCYLNVMTSGDNANYVGNVNVAPGYAYPNLAGADKQVRFPIDIPNSICGHPVVIDALTFYGYTDANEDYIGTCFFKANGGAGAEGNLLIYSNDIGNGSSGNFIQEILAVPLTLTSGNLGLSFLYIPGGTCDANNDTRFHNLKIAYHVKVHG